MDPKLLLWGYCETRDAQINLEIQSTQIGKLILLVKLVLLHPYL